MSITTTPFPRIRRPGALNDYARVRVTNETVSSFTLAAAPLAGTMQVFKNGALLDPDAGTPDYEVDGKTITLASALIVSDVVQAFFHFRDGE